MADFDINELAQIAQKSLGVTTSEVIIVHLMRQIARSQSYLERRAQRGTHTGTDEAIANDCAIAALIIKVLKGEIFL